MMDKETMEMLGQLPPEFPEPDKAYFRSDYCVKMVEAVAKPDEAFLVHLFGEDGLVEYWFKRNFLERPIEKSTGYAEENGKRFLYYGSMWKRKPRQRTLQAPVDARSVKPRRHLQGNKGGGVCCHNHPPDSTTKGGDVYHRIPWGKQVNLALF